MPKKASPAHTNRRQGRAGSDSNRDVSLGTSFKGVASFKGLRRRFQGAHGDGGSAAVWWALAMTKFLDTVTVGGGTRLPFPRPLRLLFPVLLSGLPLPELPWGLLRRLPPAGLLSLLCTR